MPKNQVFLIFFLYEDDSEKVETCVMRGPKCTHIESIKSYTVYGIVEQRFKFNFFFDFLTF